MPAELVGFESAVKMSDALKGGACSWQGLGVSVILNRKVSGKSR
jgi:hypothetical protein